MLGKFLATEWLFSKEICEDLNLQNGSSAGRYLLKEKEGYTIHKLNLRAKVKKESSNCAISLDRSKTGLFPVS